jgi:hypothetical protein
MIASCPKNPEHKQFITTAHVMQDWKVDECGNFIECVDDAVETTHGPNAQTLWTCAICGAEANVSSS